MSAITITLLLAAFTLLAMAVVMGTILGVANKVFHVPVDVRLERVAASLPGANCGACDYVGCGEYAEAILVKGEAITKCPVGGPAVASAVGEIMGVSVEEAFPVRPVVHCAATTAQRLKQTPYHGEQTCNAANLVGGIQGCVYGCLGLGDCVAVCDYDAIHMIDGVAVIDYIKCIGCGACVKACPRNIISQVPFKADRILAVQCANKDFGKEVQEVCEVGCTGCKSCARANPDLISVVDNLPVFDYTKYDPRMSLQVIQDKCRRESMVWLGKPTPTELALAANETMPARQEAEFKTTVDQTEWRG
ncbi:MAG: RnfABCDGE type electron transport complex subunit B [Polyangiaceae bacterium]|nr:RnfABCDGE type electron transport complex subunit B [Polyangiaceae bacterium]